MRKSFTPGIFVFLFSFFFNRWGSCFPRCFCFFGFPLLSYLAVPKNCTVVCAATGTETLFFLFFFSLSHFFIGFCWRGRLLLPSCGEDWLTRKIYVWQRVDLNGPNAGLFPALIRGGYSFVFLRVGLNLLAIIFDPLQFIYIN